MKSMSVLMRYPKLLDFLGLCARKIVPMLPDWIIYSKSNVWGKYRQMPKMPPKSFKELYKEGKM